MVNLAVALEKEGISSFRFDFAGNGWVAILKDLTISNSPLYKHDVIASSERLAVTIKAKSSFQTTSIFQPCQAFWFLTSFGLEEYWTYFDNFTA